MQVLSIVVQIYTYTLSFVMIAALLNLEATHAVLLYLSQRSLCLHTCTSFFNNYSLWLQGLELHVNIKFTILLQDKLVLVLVNVSFCWNICAEQTSLMANVGWNSTIKVP